MERTPLFLRLPQSWRAIDSEGILERYLGVWDKQFWEIQQKVKAILDTRNIEQDPDKFVYLLVSLIGHRWKDYKSYQWNRSRASHDITKYSYNGTNLALIDLVREHGGSYAEVVDMASKVAVWSRQGTFPNDDCHFFDADYFHPGVFQLWIDRLDSLEHFLEDFELWKPAGTKWILGYNLTNGKATLKTTASSTIFRLQDLPGTKKLPIYNLGFWDNRKKQGSMLVQ
jgi:hypothetical protein